MLGRDSTGAVQNGPESTASSCAPHSFDVHTVTLRATHRTYGKTQQPSLSGFILRQNINHEAITTIEAAKADLFRHSRFLLSK